MNSTPRDRVLAAHPEAFVVRGSNAWTVYAKPEPVGTPQKVLGRGSNAARAWKRASERLGPGRGEPHRRGEASKSASFRGF